MPKEIIMTLSNWYEKIYNCVQWGNYRSNAFNVTAGIRQGSILSPYLFIVYVDDMLKRVNCMGCNYGGYIIGAIIYADDLLFMSNSVFQLQRMLRVCEQELSLLDLKINCTKSSYMRVGHRFNKACAH